MQSSYCNRTSIVKSQKPVRQILQVQIPTIKYIFKTEGVSQTAKLVFGALNAFTNRDGNKCFPSISTLAEAVSCGRQRIRQGIDELKALGVLQITIGTNGKYIFHLKPVITVEQVVEQVVWDDTASDTNTPLGGINVPNVKVGTEGKKRGEGGAASTSPPSDNDNNLKKLFAQTSLKAKPILLKELTANALQYKKTYKQDEWDSDYHRLNYIKMRNAIRQLELDTYSFRVSTL